mgnify:CR=1 FL=1
MPLTVTTTAKPVRRHQIDDRSPSRVVVVNHTCEDDDEDGDGISPPRNSKGCCGNHVVPFFVVVGSTLAMFFVPLFTLAVTVVLVAISFWPVFMFLLPFFAAGWLLTAIALVIFAWFLRNKRGRSVQLFSFSSVDSWTSAVSLFNAALLALTVLGSRQNATAKLSSFSCYRFMAFSSP